jgi:hypothetical protein
MTAGSNGVPEDDDPFAYLYRPAGGEGGHEGAASAGSAGGAPVAQPGVPRTSYAHPTQVGRAQYGQQRPAQPGYGPPAGGYGATVPQQQQPNSQYAQHSRPQQGDGGGGSRRAASSGGVRSRPLIIGAIAVVCAVAIGAGVALMNNGDKKANSANPSVTSQPTDSGSDSASPSATAPPADSKPVADASALQVQNGVKGTGIKGAGSSDGSYVTLQQGTGISWTLQVPAGGMYKLWVHYSNPGGDGRAAFIVNGKPHASGINLKNYSGQNDPAHAWVSSYVTPNMQAGANTVTLSCDNASCQGLLVDRFAVTTVGVGEFPG